MRLRSAGHTKETWAILKKHESGLLSEWASDLAAAEREKAQVTAKLHSSARPFPTTGGDAGVLQCAVPQYDSFGNPVFQALIPLVDHGDFHGALVVEYSVERLLRYFVPTEIARRHAISVLDARGRSLASMRLAHQ